MKHRSGHYISTEMCMMSCTDVAIDGEGSYGHHTCKSEDFYDKLFANYFQQPSQWDPILPCASTDIIDGLEPTPINHQAALHAVHKVEDLPGKIKKYCEDYIAALSHLKTSTPTEDSQRDDSNPSPPPTSSSQQPQPVTSYIETLATIQEDPSIQIHPYQHERWMERVQDLTEYNRAHRHCSVPYVYKQNPALGQWVKRQRHQYKLRKQGQHCNLTEDRIHMLEMLGFIWDSHGSAWEEKFQELKEFRKIHGNCNVPCLLQGSSKLSTWIKRQRRQYRLFVANKSSTMDPERIARIEDLGLVWDYSVKASSRGDVHEVYSSSLV
jgi:hypothetical protein